MRILGYGLGNFGRPMAECLIDCGHQVQLPHTHHAASVTTELLQCGAERESVGADVCAICLPTSADVQDVVRLLNPSRAPVVLDFTTGDPEVSRTLAGTLRDRGIVYIDVPVSGSIESARKGELTIWAGARADAIPARAARLLGDLASNLFFMGDPGSGAAMKLVNQVVHTVTLAAVGEGLSLAKAAGIDLAVAAASMETSSADSAMLRRFGLSMVAGDYTRKFSLALAHKDVGLALALASSVGLQLPHAQRLYEDMAERVGAGLGDLNFSAVTASVDDLNVIRGPVS